MINNAKLFLEKLRFIKPIDLEFIDESKVSKSILVLSKSLLEIIEKDSTLAILK